MITIPHDSFLYRQSSRIMLTPNNKICGLLCFGVSLMQPWSNKVSDLHVNTTVTPKHQINTWNSLNLPAHTTYQDDPGDNSVDYSCRVHFFHSELCWCLGSWKKSLLQHHRSLRSNSANDSKSKTIQEKNLTILPRRGELLPRHPLPLTWETGSACLPLKWEQAADLQLPLLILLSIQ